MKYLIGIADHRAVTVRPFTLVPSPRYAETIAGAATSATTIAIATLPDGLIMCRII
jgi:hypothetical protein